MNDIRRGILKSFDCNNIFPAKKLIICWLSFPLLNISLKCFPLWFLSLAGKKTNSLTLLLEKKKYFPLLSQKKLDKYLKTNLPPLSDRLIIGTFKSMAFMSLCVGTHLVTYFFPEKGGSWIRTKFVILY